MNYVLVPAGESGHIDEAAVTSPGLHGQMQVLLSVQFMEVFYRDDGIIARYQDGGRYGQPRESGAP
jgi:hypothetical protein